MTAKKRKRNNIGKGSKTKRESKRGKKYQRRKYEAKIKDTERKEEKKALKGK